MPDREKLIKGLECCTFILGKRKCNECPYQKGLPDNGCYQLQDDFHALLKEQEGLMRALDQSNAVNGYLNAEVERLNGLLKEQEPKAPVHIHEEYPEHDWETDEDGNIDKWAMDYDFHNGPACKRCGYSFCMHCKPNGWNEEPCIIDYYQCPKCGRHIFKRGKNIEYCVDCGRAVKWDEVYSNL